MRSPQTNVEETAVARAREQIVELLEVLQVGERLPGERDLSKRIGVARMTLRRAIEELIVDGFLERRPGSGTYAKRPIVATEFRLVSFSDEMRRRGIQPGSKVISFRRAKANQQVSRKLQISLGDEIYLCVRLRLADDQAIALETLAIPIGLTPGLDESDFKDSLYQAMQKKYGVIVTEAQSTISAVTANKTNANLLDIPQSMPCLEVDMVDRDQFGRLFMYARCIYRGDRYEVRVNATSTSSPVALRSSSTSRAKGVS